MNATLLGEGPSDRCLLPILRWLLGQATEVDTTVEWVDASCLPHGRSLADKVTNALVVQRCDLLFVHRDADNQEPSCRYEEISKAANSHPHVAVVPVRTMEAWLLLDETAIRTAAGFVSGREPLGLPTSARVEQLANPKTVLRDALVAAAGVRGRRRRHFDPGAGLYRLADLIDDWSPLRQLSAFQQLELDTRAALAGLGLPLFPDS